MFQRLYSKPKIRSFAPRSTVRTVLHVEQLEHRLAPALLGTAQTFAVGSNPGVVAIGDFNEDTHLDMAITNQGSASISVLGNNGAGQFTTVLATLAVGGTPEGLAVGDLNKDNHLDLVVANNNGNVNILLGNGDGSFQNPTNVFINGGPDFVAVRDLDQDGNLDLIVSQFGAGAGADTVTILTGDGSGAFTAGNGLTLTGLSHPEQVVAADFDGDGLPDIAVPNQNGTNGVSVFLNTTGVGTGIQFNATPVNVHGGLSTGAATTNSGCTGLTAADFDGDGRVDLAVTNLGDAGAGGTAGLTASIFRNLSTAGNLAFGNALNLTAGNTPVGIVPGDFNSDGRIDLAVANNANGGQISVFINNGTAPGAISFPATAKNFFVGSGPQIIGADFVGGPPQFLPDGGGAPDLNGDGRSDLSVAVANTNQVAVLLNQTATTTSLIASTGTLAAGQSITFTATVVPAFPANPGVQGGTVVFREGTTQLGTGTLDAAGHASFTTSSLSAGSHSVAAAYIGDTEYSHSISNDATVTVTAVPPPPAIHLFATGADAGGGPHVQVYDADTGALRFSFFAYDSGFHGGVRIAVGDVNGDGVPDIVTGVGPGGGPHIKVFDGKTGAEIRSFFAYDPGFSFGVFVAVGDVNHDGFADIIAGAGAGGGPHVQIFSGKDNSLLYSFFAYDAGFHGGVLVATGDINDDGFADIITGVGPGGGPHVKAFDGRTGATLRSFFAYDPGYSFGVWVASGDINGDHHDDLILGAGAGGGPHVQVYSGLDNSLLQSFFTYAPSVTTGVRVGAVRLFGSTHDDILTGAGPGGGPHVRVVDGLTLDAVENFFAYDPLFKSGIFVAGR